MPWTASRPCASEATALPRAEPRRHRRAPAARQPVRAAIHVARPRRSAIAPTRGNAPRRARRARCRNRARASAAIAGRDPAGQVRVPGFCEQARDRLCQAQLRRLDLSRRGQPFQGEGLRRLEQAIARAGVVVARQHRDQRAVDQHVERIEHRPGVDRPYAGSVGGDSAAPAATSSCRPPRQGGGTPPARWRRETRGSIRASRAASAGVPAPRGCGCASAAAAGRPSSWPGRGCRASARGPRPARWPAAGHRPSGTPTPPTPRWHR